MLISYKWLQSYFEEKLPPPEKLAERIVLSFAEVEGIEGKRNTTLGLADSATPFIKGDATSALADSALLTEAVHLSLSPQTERSRSCEAPSIRFSPFDKGE